MGCILYRGYQIINESIGIEQEQSSIPLPVDRLQGINGRVAPNFFVS